jgi:hypothetical protein
MTVQVRLAGLQPSEGCHAFFRLAIQRLGQLRDVRNGRKEAVLQCFGHRPRTLACVAREELRQEVLRGHVGNALELRELFGLTPRGADVEVNGTQLESNADNVEELEVTVDNASIVQMTDGFSHLLRLDTDRVQVGMRTAEDGVHIPIGAGHNDSVLVAFQVCTMVYCFEELGVHVPVVLLGDDLALITSPSYSLEMIWR